MKPKKNILLRNKMRNNGLRMWKVAGELGMSESRLSALMRYPLDAEMKERIEQVIAKMIEGEE